MKLVSSSCAAVAAGMLLLAITTIPSQRNLLLSEAFAPTPRTNNRFTTRVKGRENNGLYSSTVTSEPTATSEPTVKKSTTTKKSQGKRKKTSSKKGKTKSRVTVKKTPKRSKSKGKTSTGKKSTNFKSFKPLKDLKLGSKVSGTVLDVCDFGAFVNIGYATRGSRAGTALLHISQIQDKRISNIREVIKVGDSIEGARVISVDLKKGEAGLSLRARRPKRSPVTKMKVGDELEGKVDSVLPYGVFVDIGTKTNALLHISRITGGAVENVRHHLNEGDPVSVHVIDIDPEKKTIAVSMLDKKADQYLDRRMSQRLKRFYGSAGVRTAKQKNKADDKEVKSTDLDYFDQAIRELEEALRDREEPIDA